MKYTSLLIGLVITILMKGGFAKEHPVLYESETLQAKIIHIPVVSLRENEKFVVEARVDGVSGHVVYMRLYFKSKNGQSYNYIEMSRSSAGYFVELEPERFSPPEMHYFLLALLSDQSVITYPEWNPYGDPVIVTVPSGSNIELTPEITEPTIVDKQPIITIPDKIDTVTTDIVDLGEESPILLLSPEDGEKFEAGEEVLIAASYGFTESEIDVNSLNIFIDGANVTLGAEKTENLLTVSKSDLEPGSHHILIQGYYASGVELPAATLTFSVEGQRKKRRTDTWVRGLVYAESRHENVSNEKFNDNNVGGSVSGKYGKTRFDARVYFTTRENGLYQPRNRYTLNVDLPLLGFTLGDTYPRFNDLMLWGKRVRGIYGRLHFGFFNIDVVHGQTQRKVFPVFNSNVLLADSLATTGTFHQQLFGIRQSFGSGRNFQLGFNLLKVKDDTTSLNPSQYNMPISDFSVPPKDNVVVGSDLMIAFANRRIEFRASGAFSLVSNDISSGGLSKEQISEQFNVDLPFEPKDYEKWFVFNSSTTPLDPRDLSSLAYNFHFRFNYFNNNLQVGYKSIGSEYVSLGNSYLRANLQGFYFTDRMRLFKNKIYLNLGYEDLKDNFNPDDENPSTTLRTINSGLSLFPGPGYPNLTFNVRNHNRDNTSASTVLDSTTAEDNNTQDFSVQLNYDVNFFQLNNSVTVSYIASDRDDRFLSLTETSSNVQLFSVRTQYEFPLITTINFARNENKFTGGADNFNFNLLGGRAEYSFFNKRLQTYFSTNYTSASGVTSLTDTTQTITNYKRLGFNIGARFEITPGHFLMIDGYLIRFTDNGGEFNTNQQAFTDLNDSYSDRIFRLYYEKRF